MTKRKDFKPTKIRCAIYTRKSTEEGLELEFNSLEAQRESAEAYIASQKAEGWTCLPDEYDDGGFSGGSLDRPALNRLMDDIAAGKVDCVVVYKVDRLSRSLLDFTRLMAQFDEHGVSFVSVTQQFNTTHSMGRLTLNILLSFAQFEREIIGERIRDKLAANCRKGKWCGGRPILGYDVDRSSGRPKLVVNAEEAKRVRKIFQLYLDKKGMTPVLHELERRGWTTKLWRTKAGLQRGGRPFDKGALYSLLRNPLYVGKIKHKSNLYDGEHEPIIKQDVFDRVQAMLEEHGSGRGKRMVNQFGALLRGLTVCPNCGRSMVHTVTMKKSRVYRYYTCGRKIKGGKRACSNGSIPAAQLEAAVVDEIRCIAEDTGLRDAIVQQGRLGMGNEVAELREQHRLLQRQLKRDQREWTELHSRNELTEVSVTRRTDLQERLSATERQLTEVGQRLKDLQHQQIDREDVDMALSNFDNVWNLLGQQEKEELVALLVAKVEFDRSDCTLAVSFHPTKIKTIGVSEACLNA